MCQNGKYSRSSVAERSKMSGWRDRPRRSCGETAQGDVVRRQRPRSPCGETAQEGHAARPPKNGMRRDRPRGPCDETAQRDGSGETALLLSMRSPRVVQRHKNRDRRELPKGRRGENSRLPVSETAEDNTGGRLRLQKYMAMPTAPVDDRHHISDMARYAVTPSSRQSWLGARIRVRLAVLRETFRTKSSSLG